MQFDIWYAICKINKQLTTTIIPNMNILVVDDAADIRAYLKAVLAGMTSMVYEASDGQQACKLIENHDIDIVLTDWMMPGMNGLDLVQWIRRQKSERYLYTILLTSRDRESDLIEGLSSGADDFLNKPVNANVLHARLKVAERIQRIQQDLLTQQRMLMESRDFLNSAYQTVQDDLAHAAYVQRSSLPQTGSTMDILSTAWRYRPAMGISGDHFDIFSIDEDVLFFYLLDVSGHGITAALRSAAISQMLRPVSGFVQDVADAGPAVILERLNQHLVRNNVEIDYLATMVMGLMDMRSKTLRIANAGHPAALLTTQEKGPVEISEFIGLPLSIEANASYRDNIVQLDSGSTLVLHSDGLTDCENMKGEHFGSSALKNCIRENAHFSADDLADGIESSIDSWRGELPITDDQSLLVIQYDNPSAEKADSHLLRQQRALS